MKSAYQQILANEKQVIEIKKQDVMDKARHKGADCPVCGQFVKVYKRTINASMAAQLARAYKKFGE